MCNRRKRARLGLDDHSSALTMLMAPIAARSGLTALRVQPSVSSLLRSSFAPLKKTAVVSPAAIATASILRPFTVSARSSAVSANTKTTSLSQSDALKLLNEQRSLRPNSPHLTIYQPQLTWYLSILTRITGVGLSGLFYVWAIGYLAVPYTGAGQFLSSAHMVQYAAVAPVWLKLAIKAPIAFALSFHSLNGIRHLFWDWGTGECGPELFLKKIDWLTLALSAQVYL